MADDFAMATLVGALVRGHAAALSTSAAPAAALIIDERVALLRYAITRRQRASNRAGGQRPPALTVH